MKGIILHGGHGTRLRPLTHTGPKQLLPIANIPMSEYCVRSLKEAGIDEICLIIGGIASDKVIDYYGDGKKFGVQFTYIKQEKPKGIAHAIDLCKDFVKDEKFVVFLGDNILLTPIKKFLDEFIQTNFDAGILLCKVDNPEQFGIAELSDKGKIEKIVEKPKTPKSDLAVTGIYFLTKKIFDIFEDLKPSWRNELEITDALQNLLNKGGKIQYNLVSDYWKDTGTPEDILKANAEILKNSKPFFKVEKPDDLIIHDNIMVSEGTIIDSGVEIFGPVLIGKNCMIGPKTKIGKNTCIGNNVKISKCEIKNSIVMDDCVIDSKIKIKNSIIAKNSGIKEMDNESDEKVFLVGEGTKIFL